MNADHQEYGEDDFDDDQGGMQDEDLNEYDDENQEEDQEDDREAEDISDQGSRLKPDQVRDQKVAAQEPETITVRVNDQVINHSVPIIFFMQR